ncbi:MAG: CcmD family protein [Clostridia bacterium]|jgi:CcmD family protein|nr:CcmD family protein [Clostridia bacterium]
MTYVWAAYTLVWLFIFGYSLMLTNRQKKIEREILLLKQAIDRDK